MRKDIFFNRNSKELMNCFFVSWKKYKINGKFMKVFGLQDYVRNLILDEIYEVYGNTYVLPKKIEKIIDDKVRENINIYNFLNPYDDDKNIYFMFKLCSHYAKTTNEDIPYNEYFQELLYNSFVYLWKTAKEKIDSPLIKNPFASSTFVYNILRNFLQTFTSIDRKYSSYLNPTNLKIGYKALSLLEVCDNDIDEVINQISNKLKINVSKGRLLSILETLNPSIFCKRDSVDTLANLKDFFSTKNVCGSTKKQLEDVLLNDFKASKKDVVSFFDYLYCTNERKGSYNADAYKKIINIIKENVKNNNFFEELICEILKK